jgi:putative ABC transport system substrate-binding protein
MKKVLCLLLAALLTLGLAACGTGTETGNNDATTTTAAPAQDAHFTVGICQLAPHPALDAATKGFRDALEEAMPGQITFDEQNAAGDSATCATIANGFVSNNVDLILANATSALQAVASATSTIPVLGTSITEYGAALQIKDFNGTVGNNVSGTSDLAPLDQQAAMVKELFPDAKTVGLLYCSAEANSLYQIDVVEAELTKLGYSCKRYPFADSNDIAAVTQTAVSESDVLYVPTDNQVADNAGIVDGIARPAKIPVIAGEENICAGCGVATLSIDYYELGVVTGKMAAKILTGESKIEEMPVEYAPQFTKKYNAAICEELGVTAPDGYVAIEG